MPEDPRRQLPSVDRLLRLLEDAGPELPAWARREGARRALAEARAAIEGGGAVADPEPAALAIAADLARPRPIRVVNASGVVLHTNLGRAALPREVADAVAAAAASYSALELDLESGARGERGADVADLLRLLSGAEDALAVNNGAAAVLLALAALARGREVIVSRGELVEIGGSFRVPEILREAGVHLVEVGTTNRTHARDYEAALGPRTGAILKVHRSNFELRGFVAEVALPELVALARREGVPVVEDLGSATLVDLRPHGLPRRVLRAGPARDGRGPGLLLGGQAARRPAGRHRARAPPSACARCARARSPARCASTSSRSQRSMRPCALLLAGRERELPTLRMLLEPAELVARTRRRPGRAAPQGGAARPQRDARGDACAGRRRLAAGLRAAERGRRARRAAPAPRRSRARCAARASPSSAA